MPSAMKKCSGVARIIVANRPFLSRAQDGPDKASIFSFDEILVLKPVLDSILSARESSVRLLPSSKDFKRYSWVISFKIY